LSPIGLLKQDDDPDQELIDDESDGSGESPLSSEIAGDDLYHLQKVLLLRQVGQDKSLRNGRVPLLKKRSPADTVIALPPHPNSRNPAAAMAPPLLKHQSQLSSTN